jgi:YfiH family protein
MLHLSKNGLHLLQFELIAALPGVIHAVTTRAGGVSRPPFDSLNLGGDDDDPQAIMENRDRLQKALGLARLVWGRQVHAVNIAAADGQEPPIPATDGLCTDQPGMGLLIKQADCQAVILVAPGKAAANLHVGWRGSVANLPARGVEFIKNRYGIAPQELYAAISPGLGPCCAEFVNHRTELGPKFLPYQVRPNFFDLERASVDQLIAAGVRPERIQISGLCTRCGREFFSFRREGLTGRFGTVVALG